MQLGLQTMQGEEISTNKHKRRSLMRAAMVGETKANRLRQDKARHEQTTD
jgi:hypothetical protein